MRSSCKLIGLIATIVAPALVSAQTFPPFFFSPPPPFFFPI